jgi:hypothetical protein
MGCDTVSSGILFQHTREPIFPFHFLLPRTYTCIFFLFIILVPTTRLYGVIPSNHIITLKLVSLIPSSHDCFSRYDFDKQHFSYEVTVPRIEIIGKYTVSGRILLLPISGNGDVNVTLGN